MSSLVKKLRFGNRASLLLLDKAADRIKELEAELERERGGLTLTIDPKDTDAWKQLEAENERLREKRDFWKRRADSRQDHIDALRKEIMENAKEGTDETT